MSGDPKPPAGFVVDGAGSPPPPPGFVPDGGAPAAQPEGRPWYQRLRDAYNDEASVGGTGVIGALTRAAARNLPQSIIGGPTDAELAAKGMTRDQLINQTAKDERAASAAREAADPAWQADGSTVGNVGRKVAGFAGGILGDANPTYLLGPGEALGKTMLGRTAAMAAIGGGEDVALQGNEMREGLQTGGYDPLRTLVAAGSGAAFQAGVAEPLGALVRRLRGRAAPDGGTVPDMEPVSVADQVHPDVAAALASKGYHPDQFHTPESASAAAVKIDPRLAMDPGIAAAAERANPTPGPAGGIPDQLDPAVEAQAEANAAAAEAGNAPPIIVDPAGQAIAPNADAVGRAPEQRSGILGRVAQDRGDAMQVANPLGDAAFRVTGRFGEQRAAQAGIKAHGHKGLDMAVPVGTRVVPAGRGVVSFAGESHGYGNRVVVDHGNGVETTYNHLSQINVRPGQSIGADTLVGLTGGARGAPGAGDSHGPHLHFEVKVNGQFMDPARALEGAALGKGAAQTPAGLASGHVATPEPEPVVRAPDWSEAAGSRDMPYTIDGTSRPMAERPSTNMGEAENPAARQSQTQPEMAQPGAMGEPMATGDSSRPFKAAPGDDGGFHEARAADTQKAAAEEMEARWQQRRKSGEQQEDVKAKYGGKYGQRPVQDDGGLWRTTDDGFVADHEGNPVAFRNAREAAGFAAKNDLGGDFDLHVWGTNDARVTLRRREGSAYGQTPPPPEGFVPDAPAAIAETKQLAGPRPEAQPHAATVEELPTVERPIVESQPAAQPAREPGPTTEKGGDLSTEAAAVTRDRPELPTGKEPKKPTGLMNHLATVLDGETKRDGISTRISAEDAVNHGVPAELIYNDPSARYPTVKANAAKVFSSEKAPLNSRAKPVHTVSLDNIRDRVDPQRFGHEGRVAPLEPHELGDMLRRDMEGDGTTLDRSHPTYESYKEWNARYEDAARAIDEWENRYGQDWNKLSDDQLAAIDNMMDEAVNAGDKPEVDPFDPRFWDEGHGQTAETPARDPAQGGQQDQGEPARDAGQPEAGRSGGQGGGRDGGDPGQSEPGPGASAEPSQSDAFGSRDGDQRRAAERAAAGRLKADAPQKAPGSDGGLFDDASHGKQGDAFDFLRHLFENEDGSVPRRTFGRKTPSERADGPAPGHDDPVVEAARERDRMEHVENRRDGIVERAKASLQGLLGDERGSFNPAKVVDFFVDRKEVKDDAHGIAALATALKGTTATAALDRAISGFWKFRSTSTPAVYAGITDTRWRSMAKYLDAPAMNELADKFEHEAGKAQRGDKPYHEAVREHQIKFTNRLHDALAPLEDNAASLGRVRDLLTGKARAATAAEKDVAKNVRELLNEVHEYRSAAGEELGKVGDYFQRVIDPDKVMANRAKFELATQKLYRMIGYDPAQAQMASAEYFRRVLSEATGVDGSLLEATRAKSPGTLSGKERIFGPEADALMRDFYHTDPVRVLQSYIMGSVKRAEFNRSLGMKGRAGSPEREAWIEATKDYKHPNGRTQLQMLEEQIQEQIAAHGDKIKGSDAMALVQNGLEGNLGILGHLSPGFRQTISYMHLWNQIGKMTHAVVSSFPEMAMGVVHTGDIRQLVPAIKTTVQEVVREISHLPPSEARVQAEHLGIISNADADHTLQSRMSAMVLTGKAQRLTSKFYRTMGLTQYTDATRVAMFKIARTVFNAHVDSLDSANAKTAARARRYFAEYGVRDVEGMKGFIQKYGGGQNIPVGEIDKASVHAKAWNQAMYRMVAEMIMEPTRAQKPVWANHPVGSLAYGLASYSFSFKKKVIDRVLNKAGSAIIHRDIHEALPLLVGLPTLMGATYLNEEFVRRSLFGGADRSKMTATDKAMSVADRSNLTGFMSPVVNALFHAKYNRPLSEAFLGSVLGSVADEANKMFQGVANPGKHSNGKQRAAAQALYDMVVEPATNVFATKYLKGPVAFGTTWFSGNKEGSALIAPRDHFVDAVAGPSTKGHKKDPWAGDTKGKDPWAEKPTGKDPWAPPKPGKDPWTP